MASKQVRQRWSWALDELAREMAAHYDMPDVSALTRGVLRYLATVDKSTHLTWSRRIAQESPEVQDKIDAELLRMWRAGEHLHGQKFERTIREVLAEEGRDDAADRVAELAAEEFIKRVKGDGA